MTLKIDSVTIQDFRGIRRLRLPFDGRNLIITGENGSGKSSIIDAIEYLFTDHVSKLQGRQDVRESRSIPHLQGETPKISLHFLGGSEEPVTAVFPQGKTSIPTQFQSFVKLAALRPFILRRTQILDFVNARPGERYRHISQLIGLEELDTIDRNWRKERDKIVKQRKHLEAELGKTKDRLGELLGKAVDSEEELIRTINRDHIVGNLEPIFSRADLVAVQKMLAKEGVSSDKQAELNTINNLQRDAQSAGVHLEMMDKHLQVWRKNRRVFNEKSAILADSDFEQLLVEAQQLVQKIEPLKNCPVCEQPILDAAGFLKRLQQRLQALRELTNARRRMQESINDLGKSILQYETSIRSVLQDLPVNNYQADVAILKRQSAELREWQSFLNNEGTGVVESISADRINEWRSCLNALQRDLEANANGLSLDEEELARLELFNLFTRIDENWQRIEVTTTELIIIKRVEQKVTTVYESILAARRKGLTSLSKDLEKDFVTIYQELHPDEGYDNITMPVQSGKRSSIDLSASFYGEDDAHPLNFFSEGHLDSLGLCIFLAFIKRFNRDLKLIILDDVLTTVDAGHRLRVARLLARHFSDYQLIITTHDQLWARELERIISRSRLIILKRWTMNQGTDCWDNVLTDWDYYIQQAQNGRSQDAIAGVGRNLEKFLFHMRANLRLAVPAKPNSDYTIGDLYGPFFEWLNKRSIERADWPDFAEHLQRMQSELDEVWRLRNWTGAHFNEWGERVTSAEAISFNHTIRRLVEAFECPVCHDLVVYDYRAKVLLCPTCEPAPPPRPTWQYRPDWYETASHLIAAPNARTRGNVVPMVHNVTENFLNDIRRRVSLPIPAAADDQYNFQQIYEPFMAWAQNHPRDEHSDWARRTKAVKARIDKYRHEDRWSVVMDYEISDLVEAVHDLIGCFSCSECCQLLNYDYQFTAYRCADCQQSEAAGPAVSAYWFVRKR